MPVIIIYKNDGTNFLLYVSNEAKKDREFGKKLIEVWKTADQRMDAP